MTNGDPLSFAKDIRPMFTDIDVAHMKIAGIDLSDRNEVMMHADAIYQTVSTGAMPPPSSGEALGPLICATASSAGRPQTVPSREAL